MKDQSLSGKCILIICGQPEIGQAITAELAASSALIFITAPEVTNLDETVHSVRENLAECSIVGKTFELNSSNAIDELFLDMEIAFPKMDVLIKLPLADTKANDNVFRRCAEKAFVLMKRLRSGHIVDVQSSSDSVDLAGLRQDYKPWGIKLTSVRAADTTPEKIAKTIRHLLTEPEYCYTPELRIL
jgi:hypothetical protein